MDALNQVHIVAKEDSAKQRTDISAMVTY